VKYQASCDGGVVESKPPEIAQFLEVPDQAVRNVDFGYRPSLCCRGRSWRRDDPARGRIDITRQRVADANEYAGWVKLRTAEQVIRARADGCEQACFGSQLDKVAAAGGDRPRPQYSPWIDLTWQPEVQRIVYQGRIDVRGDDRSTKEVVAIGMPGDSGQLLVLECAASWEAEVVIAGGVGDDGHKRALGRR